MIEMAQFDDWVDGVNTYIATQTGSAANVPRVIVVHVVRSAVRKFLVESKVWVHKPHTTIPRMTDRLLMIPRDTFICKIWQIRENSCLTQYMTYSYPNVVSLDKLSERDRESEDLKHLEVSLSVTQTSLECPMFVFDRYYDGILSGALANLQAMPGKVWADPSMVAYHRDIYEQSIISAKNDVSAGLNRQKSSTSIPASFM